MLGWAGTGSVSICAIGEGTRGIGQQSTKVFMGQSN